MWTRYKCLLRDWFHSVSTSRKEDYPRLLTVIGPTTVWFITTFFLSHYFRVFSIQSTGFTQHTRVSHCHKDEVLLVLHFTPRILMKSSQYLKKKPSIVGLYSLYAETLVQFPFRQYSFPINYQRDFNSILRFSNRSNEYVFIYLPLNTNTNRSLSPTTSQKKSHVSRTSANSNVLSRITCLLNQLSISPHRQSLFFTVSKCRCEFMSFKK